MSFFSNLLTAALIYFSGGTYAAYIAVAAFAVGTYNDMDARRRARHATQDFNRSLKDRYQMVKGGTEPRKLLYGRARISGPIVYAQSTGTKKEFLHLVVALVGHECDAIETVLFNDVALPAEDGSGFIQSGEYARTDTLDAVESFTGTSKVLAHTPSAIVTVTRESGSGDLISSVTLATPADWTLAGATLSVPGGGNIIVNYQWQQTTPKVRIKKFLGTSTQAASSDLVSESGGKWTSAHQLKGICYLYVRLEYDQNVFGQSGLPNISAIVRGKKVYDPRLDSTAGGSGSHRIATPSTWAWSENAALCTADYLRDATYGMVATAAQTPAAESITAANVCDQAVLLYNTGTVAVVSGSPNVTGTGTSWLKRVRPGMNFVGPNAVSMTVLSVTSDTALVLTANYGGSSLSGQAYAINEPRYTCNGVLDSADPARNNLDKLVECMAGTVVWTQGRWLIRAGAHLSASLTITEDWLGDKAPQISPRAPRQELFNRVLATYAEREKLYTETQAPPVTNATYVSDDGALDLPTEVTYDLCTGGVRAQRLAKIHLERARQALTVRLSCNLKAYDLSPSDVVALTLARYGWSAKLFEVVQRTLDPQSWQVELLLRETASGVWDWALGAETAIDLTPNTDLPNPFTPPAALTGLTVTSGTAQLLKLGDGSIITRALVAWAASADVYTASGGRIEIRWKLDNATEWVSAPSVPGDSLNTLIGPLDDLRVNIVQVRPVNSRGRFGAWTTATHLVVGKTAAPANVASLTATIVQGGARIAWADNTEVDYESTELRFGASWAAGTRLFRGNASSWTWLSPAQATYTVWAKHWDTTGNESATAASVSVVIDAAALVIIGATQFTGTIGSANFLTNSSFQVDSNADGYADGWTAYSNGTTGVRTASLVSASALDGRNRQRLQASGLGTGGTDRVGIEQAFAVGGQGGKPFVFSAYLQDVSNSNEGVRLYIEFRDSSAAIISTAQSSGAGVSGAALNRLALTGTVPVGTFTANVFIWAENRPTVGAVTLDIDHVQFEIGDVITAYTPRADEILASQVGTVELADEAATTVLVDSVASPSIPSTPISRSYPAAGTYEVTLTAKFVNTTYTTAHELNVWFSHSGTGTQYGVGLPSYTIQRAGEVVMISQSVTIVWTGAGPWQTDVSLSFSTAGQAGTLTELVMRTTRIKR